MEAARALGIRLIACEAGLRAESLAAESLAEGVEVAGIVTFLGAVGPGQVISL
jgi:predicted peroxiredoxin